MVEPMSKPTYVFESPDGGKTIYRRTTGNAHRELWYEADEVVSLRREVTEDQEWHQIRQAAKKDPTLAHMLEEVKMYWILSR
jgi:hypothetical protein